MKKIYFLALATIASCGLSPEEALKKDLEKDLRSIPTAANFSDWKDNWVKDSWVVGFQNNPGQTLPLVQDVKRKAVEKYLLLNGFEKDTHQFSLYGTFLADNTHVQPIYFAPENSEARKNTSFHFLTVTFNKSQFFQESVTQILAPTFLLDSDKEKSKAIQQWASLQANDEAAWVEPNLFTEVPSLEGDVNLIGGSHHEIIKMASTYEKYKDVNPGYKIKVAIIDTGVDYGHPDLVANMFKNPNEMREGLTANGLDDDNNGYIDDIHGIDATIPLGGANPDSPGPGDIGGPGKPCPPDSGKCGHGTHVAGLVAAKYTGTSGAKGSCLDRCEIISLRVAALVPNASGGFKNSGIADDAQIRALQYLNNLRDPLQGNQLLVDIVNMSLGKRFRSRGMGHAVTDIQKGGKVIVVAAAGNDDTDTPSYPAGYAAVLSVCSVDSAKVKGDVYSKSIFSNFGYWVDICAPGGEDTNSTWPGGGYKRIGGTSMASPIVAGAIGFFLSVSGPNRPSPEDVIQVFKNSANANALYQPNSFNELYAARYPDGTKFFLLGTGLLDMQAALNRQLVSYVDQEQNTDRVRDGCIIRSSVAGSRLFSWQHTSSFPFLLFNFFLCMRLHRKYKQSVGNR